MKVLLEPLCPVSTEFVIVLMVLPAHSLRPLLCLSPLLPGESLYSLLIRLAAKNYHTLSTILTLGRLCRTDNPLCSHQPEAYDALAKLANLPVNQIYQATLHRFAPVLTYKEIIWRQLPDEQPPVPLLPPNFRTSIHIHSHTDAQFCPHCLAQAPYHRLAWTLRVVTACLPHHCLLLTGCPTCGGKLPVAAVVKAVCPGCQTDLRQLDPAPLDKSGRLAQQVIQSWFDVVDAPPDVSLPDLLPSTIYKQTLDLARLVKAIDPAWIFFPHGLTGPHRNYTTAIKSIADWPVSFYALLDAYRDRPGRPLSSAVTGEFGTLYTYGLKKFWLDLAPVQQAFDDYIRQSGLSLPYIWFMHRFRDSDLPTTFIPYAETMRRLNTSRNTVMHLSHRGLIGRDTEAANRSNRICFPLRRSDVLTLQAGWSTPRPIIDLAWLLAADEALVVALLAAGLLPEPTYAAACELLDRLQEAVTWPAIQYKALSLLDMPDPVAVLRLILAGQVRVYFGGRLGLNYLRFTRNEACDKEIFS